MGQLVWRRTAPCPPYRRELLPLSSIAPRLASLMCRTWYPPAKAPSAFRPTPHADPSAQGPDHLDPSLASYRPRSFHAHRRSLPPPPLVLPDIFQTLHVSLAETMFGWRDAPQ